MHLYSLYDSKADGFTPPFVAKNDDIAIRVVLDTYSNVGKCPLTQFPEDFTLFQVADWNDDTGEVAGIVKRSVANVFQLVNGSVKDAGNA